MVISELTPNMRIHTWYQQLNWTFVHWTFFTGPSSSFRRGEYVVQAERARVLLGDLDRDRV